MSHSIFPVAFAMTLDAYVVSHTHWDREWYHPAERFQQRLVALVDELLNDPPAGNESFLIDGQTIVLDDYLAVRPERAAELADSLRSRRIEAGPWYVLADELIPSGESIVRNLLEGRRALARVGAASPNVLYCPDSFGHPAVLPAVAAGFGLPVIVLWRGYGSARWPTGDTVRWSAPNGDAALLYHLPRDGYEFGSHLPTDESNARERWHRMREELGPRSTAGVVLVPNGADHHARQAALEPAVNALIAAGREVGDRIHKGSLRLFSERLLAASATRKLPSVRGELRDSYGYTWTLQGTFATRAHEKRANARADRMLTREAEPWAALATVSRGGSRRGLVQHAWRSLLQAHPHDTLCGCSIDEVAESMELRVRSAATEAEGIRDDAIASLIAYDAAAARENKNAWKPIVVIRNAAARVRSGVAVVDVEQFLSDVPVGPGSATAYAGNGTVSPRAARVPSLGALQTLSRRREYSLIESPHHYPDNDLVVVTRVAAWVSEVAGYGLACHAIGLGATHTHTPVDRVAVERNTLSNGTLTVSVRGDGGVELLHVPSGRRIESLLRLIDETDVGDLYTPAPRAQPFTVEFRGCRSIHAGPLRGELSVRYRVVATEGRRRATADVTVNLVLDAGAPFVRLSVRGDNHGTNHRVRMVIGSDCTGGETWADAAFGPVQRAPIVVSREEAKVEAPPPTAPLHRYVSRFAGERGATVVSDGLAEYESRDDGSIIVTLVRAVGELSRNDIPERPGHAGWPRPTPRAQCLGPFEAELAVLLHGGRTVETIDEIERAADDVLTPLVGHTLRSALEVPEPFAGITLTGDGLAMSAIKESDDGEWLVLRCVNLSDTPTTGEWALSFSPGEARQSRLDETPMHAVLTTGNLVPIVAAPRDVVTILVR